MRSVPFPDVVIRPATVSDAAGLETLHRGIYAEGRWFVGDSAPTTETLRGRLRALAPERSLYLVAAETGGLGSGKLQGWLELHRLTPQKLAHVAVLTLAVGSAFRRQGVAGALLAHAYPWAREVGVLKVQLSVPGGQWGGGFRFMSVKALNSRGANAIRFLTMVLKTTF